MPVAKSAPSPRMKLVQRGASPALRGGRSLSFALLAKLSAPVLVALGVEGKLIMLEHIGPSDCSRSPIV